MSATQRGEADHRAVELFERLAIVARRNGATDEQVERLIIATIIEDAAWRWWEDRGYMMPPRHEDSAKDFP